MIKLFETRHAPLMFNLENVKFRIKFNNSALEQQSSSSLYLNFMLKKL